MESVGNFFKWLLGLIPIWGWVLAACSGLFLIGGFAFKVYVDRTVSGYEKRIEEETLAKNNAVVEKNAALGNAATTKEQRDSLLADIGSMQDEMFNIGKNDTELQKKLSASQRALNAKAAQERARLGDPAQFQAQLDTINGEVGCAIENINQPGSCVVQ